MHKDSGGKITCRRQEKPLPFPEEQIHLAQTLERLEGTNVERLLQAGILGSDETLKRYIGLYVDSGREPPLLAGKNRESIIRDFDIMDFIPR